MQIDRHIPQSHQTVRSCKDLATHQETGTKIQRCGELSREEALVNKLSDEGTESATHGQRGQHRGDTHTIHPNWGESLKPLPPLWNE